MSSNNLYQHIDEQLVFNKGKNLFNANVVLSWTDNLVSIVKEIDTITTEDAQLLINYITNNVLREFCRINQYYNFDSQARKELHNIYASLLSDCLKKGSVSAIIEKHNNNLQHWLRKSNPFAEKVYATKDEILEPVTCAEYSAEMQMQLLQLKLSTLQTPVLDIGCGESATLVNNLRENGIEAYGIDRFDSIYSYVENTNWLEYDYGVGKWGTIVSNLGFSNHFRHHHLREDGDFVTYAQKYMEILASLKPGGSFHYAPDLPFIEQYLDRGKFVVDKYVINNQIKTTIIKKMS